MARKQIRGANPEELPRLLRLEAMLRREVERLANLARPAALTGDFDALLDELRTLPALDE